MKKIIFTALIFIYAAVCSAQAYKFEYTGGYNPTVKREKLNHIQSISEITSELWQKMFLMPKERDELEHRRKMDSEQGCYVYYPQGYNYERLVEYVSAEVSLPGGSKLLSTKNIYDNLTALQRASLSSVVTGMDIVICVKFTYKKRGVDHKSQISDTIMGQLAVTVVPEKEAEFPGGVERLSKYLNDNVMNMISSKRSYQQLQQSVVEFTVNEQGLIINVAMARPSGNANIDMLITEAVKQMPPWKPAQNKSGIKVKQEFRIPFGKGGGC
ncbi:MAG: energy transducer TonB [Bacteroidia bacterium]